MVVQGALIGQAKRPEEFGGGWQPGGVVDTGDTRLAKMDHHGGAVHAEHLDGATAQAARHGTMDLRAGTDPGMEENDQSAEATETESESGSGENADITN